MAVEAGFDSVEHFAAEHLRTLAHYPSLAEMKPLTEEELQESLAKCDRGMAEFEAGGGVDARKALEDMGRKRGFTLNG